MTPSRWLVAGCVALAVLGALAPLWPRAVAAAAVLAALLLAAATFDALRALDASAAQYRLLGPARLTVGRSAPLRLAMDGPTDGVAPRTAVMPATAEFATGVTIQRDGEALSGRARGRFRGLRVGTERRSPWRLWQRRAWQTLDDAVAVYPDLAPARRELFRSPVLRALGASTVLPLPGRGREFERLREYQPGDLYADLSWKATARRGHPVTRLFQAEQQQEIYIVVEHGRRSRPVLDRTIETALAAAMAAHEVGDRFGLITFADSITGWRAAASGRAHFAACREMLLGLPTLDATPDFDALVAALRVRLRKRCYVLLLSDLTERGLAETLERASRVLRRTHLVLAASIVPDRPLGDDPYVALAHQREQARIAALTPRLRLAGVEFCAVSATTYLSAAVGGYLDAKQRQRL